MTVRLPVTWDGYGVSVSELARSFVIKVGVRQAWLFLGFCDIRGDTAKDSRLYVDTTWQVGATGGTATDDLSWLGAAAELNGVTVTRAEVVDHGSLLLATADGLSLTVSGEATATTTAQPWWIWTAAASNASAAVGNPHRPLACQGRLWPE